MKKLKLTKKYEKYPEYKNSGAEWLGKIPKEWNAQKIVSVFDFPNEKVTEADYEPLSVTYDGIKKQIENAAKVAEGSMRKLVKVGDIAINGRSDRKGAVGVSEYEGGVSLVYNVLRKRKKDSNSKYFHYLMRSNLFSEEFYRWGRGIVDDLWTTRANEMKRIFITEPNPSAQTHIASYLDKKTALIDKIINLKQKQIELFREKRIAVINQSVTRGLDPKVELVESGIEWIGKSPRKWQNLAIKRLLKSFDYGISETLSGEGDIKVLTMGNIQDGVVLIPENGCINFVEKNLLLKKNDILFNRTNSFELVGKVGIFKEAETNVTFASYLVRFRCNQRVIPDYLNYLLNSLNFVEYARGLALRSISQANLNPNRYGKIIVPLPSITEQEKIVEYLEKNTRHYDKIEQHIEQSIELLEEFKSSLISHVVTGKIKV